MVFIQGKRLNVEATWQVREEVELQRWPGLGLLTTSIEYGI